MEVASQHWTDWTVWTDWTDWSIERFRTIKAKCRMDGWMDGWMGWGYPILL